MAGETGTVESGLDTAAYNLAVYYPFRSGAVFNDAATIKPTKQSHRGATVTFTKMNELAVDDTPLNEYTDVTATALTDAPLVVTLTEYGRATVSTAKLRGTSFIEFDPTAANRLGYNAVRTIDKVAQKALQAEAASELVVQSGGIAEKITSDRVRQIKATLMNADVPPFRDGYYRAIVSPYQARDLLAETGEKGWRAPHNYSDITKIYRGEVGEYEGFRFISYTTLEAGTEANSRRSTFYGQECLAKAFSEAPGFGSFPVVRPGPVTDKLLRFRPMGWYWLGGFKCFRPEAVIWADFNHAAI